MAAEQADVEAFFDRLFKGAYRPLLAYALRRGASRPDAEELVAETLLTAWRRRAELPPGDGALPWLYAVARRVLANQRRAQLRRERLARLLAPLARPAADPLPQAELADEARDVLAALASLAEGDQEVLRLSAWEGLSHREIGVSLGCSENAAALRLHRARLRLRAALLKEGRAPGQEVVEVTRR